MMKTKYFIGDSSIPWWVKKLVDCGLIIEVRESAAITFILTFKTTADDTNEYYLYNGDFLELNEETGSVTIGHNDWDKALAEDFEKLNWNKFVETLKKDTQDKEKKVQYETDYNSYYWS